MPSLSPKKLYTRDEMARAVVSAGQFAHVSEGALIDSLDWLYNRNIYAENDDDYETGTAVPGVLVQAFRQGLCQPLYQAVGTLQYMRHQYGALCCLCGCISHAWVFELPSDIASYVSQRFLRIRDERHTNSPTCVDCTNFLSHRKSRRAYFAPMTVDEMPARLLELVQNSRFRERMRASESTWEKLRFDPRKYPHRITPTALKRELAA